MATLNVQKASNQEGLTRHSEPFSDWEPFRRMRHWFGWDPFAEMMRIPPMEPAMTFAPAFEVKETPAAYVFKADLPGIKEQDLDIKLIGDRLTITGKRETERQEKDETYYCYERSYGTFTRSFTLPWGVTADLAKAELKDGVLSVMLPKSPETLPKKIEIKNEKAKA